LPSIEKTKAGIAVKETVGGRELVVDHCDGAALLITVDAAVV